MQILITFFLDFLELCLELRNIKMDFLALPYFPQEFLY